MKYILLILLIVSQFGCVSVGRKIPISKVSDIKIGKSTIDDVRILLGKPIRSGYRNGRNILIYSYHRYELFADGYVQTFQVEIENNIVVDKFYTSTDVEVK